MEISLGQLIMRWALAIVIIFTCMTLGSALHVGGAGVFLGFGIAAFVTWRDR